MRTAIVYYSKHHGNTKKLLDAITLKHEVVLIDATTVKSVNLNGFDRIGFASGIYYSKFHKTLLKFAEENLPNNKPVFFLYTYGAEKKGYTEAIEAVAREKNSKILDSFGCFGFNTFGPFKLIGGIAKGHPDSNDLANAVAFYEGL